jgi:hypothetical protein
MWYNPLITWLLRSPLHRLLSLNMMLITYTGRKSGKKLSVPVSYVRDENTLWVLSLRRRTWWRSLQGGAPVTLRLRGKDVPAQAEALLDDLPSKIAGLKVYASEYRDVAKVIGIHFDADRQPILEDVTREAKARVMVRVLLAGSD